MVNTDAFGRTRGGPRFIPTMFKQDGALSAEP